jgi:glycosyltransferase involved in cell wall biosynthesis
MNSLKIFVSAYACEPNLGSEIGVGWHWVLEMSKYFDLWVLTRRSNKQNIEAWITKHPEFKHINFIYYDLPYYLRFWKKGIRGVRLYYNIWQWCTNRIVKKTMQANTIEIFHHLTYGNALWSVSSYGKKQFFVWGPQGGTETIPKSYTSHYNTKGKLIESIRRKVIKMLPYNTGFQNRCKHANLILSKTEIHKNNIPLRYKHKAVLFTDVATSDFKADLTNNHLENNAVTFIVVGKLDPWRGFDLLIEAFAKALIKNRSIKLQILGRGLDYERLNILISSLHVGGNIDILGQVPLSTYNALMQKADVVVNPCLKEGAVTTAFDAMAMGKPLICIDTTGYTKYFSSDYAVIIPIQSRSKTIEDLSNALLKLTDVNLRKQMGAKAVENAQNFTWENRGQEIHKVITEHYNNWLISSSK